MNHNLELAKVEFEFLFFHFMLVTLQKTLSYLQLDEKNMEFLELFVVQSLSCIWLFVIHGLQCTRLPCPSLSFEVYSNACPLSRWCHPTISSSVLPFSSWLASWIPLQSKGLSRVFSSTTVQKHQFFGVQPSLWSDSYPYMTTGKTIALTIWNFGWQSDVSTF